MHNRTGQTTFRLTGKSPWKNWAKFILMAFFLLTLPASIARAQSPILPIDEVASPEDLEFLKKYIDVGRFENTDKIYTLKDLHLIIFRIESPGTCFKSSKCLTIVIQDCGREKCAWTSVVGAPQVFEVTSKLDIFGRSSIVVFGYPTSDALEGTGVIVGRDLMAAYAVYPGMP